MVNRMSRLAAREPVGAANFARVSEPPLAA
jgi:hypothetical protein